MLWHLRIQPAEDEVDRVGARLAREAHELGLGDGWSIHASRGFLIAGRLSQVDARSRGAGDLCRSGRRTALRF